MQTTASNKRNCLFDRGTAEGSSHMIATMGNQRPLNVRNFPTPRPNEGRGSLDPLLNTAQLRARIEQECQPKNPFN